MKNNLEKALRAKGISQTSLSNASGISRATINGLVHQKMSPSLRTMEKISKALEIPIEDIFFKADVIFELQDVPVKI